MIDRELVAGMFENMRTSYGWDLSKPLVWSFFFVGSDSAAWDDLRQVLTRQEYEVRPIGGANEEKWMQADRVVRLSEEQLNDTNDQLADLATQFGLTYDGMECGPLPTAASQPESK